MIIGRIEISATALHTHKDSYQLRSITAVSTPRVWLVPGLMLAAGLCGFTAQFHALLYPWEVWALLGIATLSAIFGLSLAQLRLTSLDLRGSEIADVIMGSHGHLNRLRPHILKAAESAGNEGDAP